MTTIDGFGDQTARLEAMVDLVIPPDEFPSATQAGALAFLAGYLRERPDLRPRLDRLISRCAAAGSEAWSELSVEVTVSERLLVDRLGRVSQVALVGRLTDGRVWRRSIAAAEFVVAGGAIESARLLLNSAHDDEPVGIGNGTDQVGRHLQGHVYGGAIGIFDEEVEDLVGPGPSLATHDFRHQMPGIVGGGILVDEFVPLPANVYRMLIETGLIPRWGLASKQGMRRLLRRTLRVMGPIQEVTSAESRVRVDPHTYDGLGVPVARLSGTVHANDRAAQSMIAAKALQWLITAGATKTALLEGVAPGPSAGQHQAGTCRMGNDPRRSVVDLWCRVWGHDNLWVTDGSVHVTNGAVNPVLTIFANSYRAVSHLITT